LRGETPRFQLRWGSLDVWSLATYRFKPHDLMTGRDIFSLAFRKVALETTLQA
jgi:hypothetical protein